MSSRFDGQRLLRCFGGFGVFTQTLVYRYFERMIITMIESRVEVE